MKDELKSVLKHGEHVESLKYKEKEGMKKLKVKFEKGSPKEIAIKKRMAHIHN